MRFRSVAALLPVLTAAACGGADLAAPGARQATAQFSLAATPPRSSVAAQTAPPDLVIQRVQFAVGQLELTPASAAGAAGSSAADACRHGGQGGRAHLALPPTIFDVAVDGTVQPQVRVDVPAGTYCELELALRPGAGDAASLQRLPDLRTSSIRVTGTFRGAPFVFVSALGAELEVRFAPPVVVSDSLRNITLTVDVARWFVDASGTAVSPSSANAGGPNAALVERNIRASFRAFEDDRGRGEAGGEHGDGDHGSGAHAGDHGGSD